MTLSTLTDSAGRTAGPAFVGRPVRGNTGGGGGAVVVAAVVGGAVVVVGTTAATLRLPARRPQRRREPRRPLRNEANCRVCPYVCDQRLQKRPTRSKNGSPPTTEYTGRPAGRWTRGRGDDQPVIRIRCTRRGCRVRRGSSETGGPGPRVRRRTLRERWPSLAEPRSRSQSPSGPVDKEARGAVPNRTSRS